MDPSLDSELRDDFLVEAGELVQRLGEQLVALEEAPRDAELLNAVFRAFHTVKGGAGFLGIDPMVQLCHHAEDLLNEARAGHVLIDAARMDALLEALDLVNAMMAALVWALIASLYIGNVMLLVLNLPMVGLWVKLLKIPKPQLYAGILIFATVGAYGMRQSAFDLFLLYAIGILGVVMRRFDFPTAPVVVGMILGPLAEAQLRNAMSIGEGSAAVFFQRPMSIALVIIVVAVLILPRLAKRMSERKLAKLAQLDA